MAENNPNTSPENEHSSTGEFIKKYAKRAWAYIKKAKMELIVMVALFVLDQISKVIVRNVMSVGQTVTVIPYVLSFTYSQNFDAAFGNTWLKSHIGTLGSQILFSIFAVVASVVFMIVLIRAKNSHKLFRVSLAMLIAGAMGNCIDRMIFVYVCDFINLDLFTLITGGWWHYIFNIADAELVIGVILVIIYFIFIYRDKPQEHADDTDSDEMQERSVQAQAAGETAAEGDSATSEAAEEGETADDGKIASDETTDATEIKVADETGEKSEPEPADAESKIQDEKEDDA